MRQRWTGHHYYEHDQLHIPILGLGAAEAWRATSEALKVIVDKGANGRGRIRLRVVGLNILNDTWIAQVIDSSGGLAQPTADLVHHCTQLDGKTDCTAGLHEELWWKTLARLAAPASDDALSFGASHRSTEFGSVNVERGKLVETSRHFELARTQIIHEALLRDS
jgi:hypothetical protein